MIFENPHSSLESDLAFLLKWHYIRPTKEVVAEFKKEVTLASKEDRSILKQIDLFIIKCKKKEARRRISPTTGRDYHREAVFRFMRTKGMTEQQAEDHISGIYLKRQFKVKERKTEFNYQDKLDESQPPIWAEIVIVTKTDVLFFQNTKEAAEYLVEHNYYKQFDTARTTICRSISEIRENHIQHWQAFRIIIDPTKKTRMKTELKRTEKAIEKLAEKLEKIASELSILNMNLKEFNEPSEPKTKQQ